MDSKGCTRCYTVKPLSEFGNSTRYLDGLQRWCRKCFADYHQENKVKHNARIHKRNDRVRNELQKYVYEYLLEHQCTDCGVADTRVLDFDHVRGEKRAPVSVLVSRSYSLETLKQEIEKCEVRCANCHRIKTYKQFGW